MASYQVLSRPEGTYASKPNVFEELIKSFGGGMKQGIIQQAAERQGLEEAVEIDPETGEIKRTYKNPKKKSFDDMLKDAASGKISWDEVTSNFPSRRDTVESVEKEYTPTGMAEGFQKGTGGWISRFRSWLNPAQAEITPDTQAVIDQIKSQADLEEFINEIDQYKDAGVDVNAVLEYFGKRK